MRILTTIFILVLALGLVACAPQQTVPADDMMDDESMDDMAGESMDDSMADEEMGDMMDDESMDDMTDADMVDMTDEEGPMEDMPMDDESADEEMMEPAVVEVDIAGFAFNPQTIEARVGDTVRFTNSDSAPHTATATSGAETFDSGTLRQGDSFEFTLTTAGTTEGICTIHPSMEFTIVAQ